MKIPYLLNLCDYIDVYNDNFISPKSITVDYKSDIRNSSTNNKIRKSTIFNIMLEAVILKLRYIYLIIVE